MDEPAKKGEEVEDAVQQYVTLPLILRVQDSYGGEGASSPSRGLLLESDKLTLFDLPPPEPQEPSLDEGVTPLAAPAPSLHRDTAKEQWLSLGDYQGLGCGPCVEDSPGVSSAVPVRGEKAPSPPQQECCLCEKQFSSSSSLNKHLVTHSQHRPHCCHICSKRFKRQDHLSVHLQTHRRSKPFFCPKPGCTRSYCDVRSLLRHSSIQHGEPWGGAGGLHLSGGSAQPQTTGTRNPDWPAPQPPSPNHPCSKFTSQSVSAAGQGDEKPALTSPPNQYESVTAPSTAVSSSVHLQTHRRSKPFFCPKPGCTRSYCDVRSLLRHSSIQHGEPWGGAGGLHLSGGSAQPQTTGTRNPDWPAPQPPSPNHPCSKFTSQSVSAAGQGDEKPALTSPPNQYESVTAPSTAVSSWSFSSSSGITGINFPDPNPSPPSLPTPQLPLPLPPVLATLLSSSSVQPPGLEPQPLFPSHSPVPSFPWPPSLTASPLALLNTGEQGSTDRELPTPQLPLPLPPVLATLLSSSSVQPPGLEPQPLFPSHSPVPSFPWPPSLTASPLALLNTGEQGSTDRELGQELASFLPELLRLEKDFLPLCPGQGPPSRPVGPSGLAGYLQLAHEQNEAASLLQQLLCNSNQQEQFPEPPLGGATTALPPFPIPDPLTNLESQLAPPCPASSSPPAPPPFSATTAPGPTRAPSLKAEVRRRRERKSKTQPYSVPPSLSLSFPHKASSAPPRRQRLRPLDPASLVSPSQVAMASFSTDRHPAADSSSSNSTSYHCIQEEQIFTFPSAGESAASGERGGVSAEWGANEEKGSEAPCVKTMGVPPGAALSNQGYDGEGDRDRAGQWCPSMHSPLVIPVSVPVDLGRQDRAGPSQCEHSLSTAQQLACRLRSPVYLASHLLNPGGQPPVSYTPPPMLSPLRPGTGLYFSTLQQAPPSVPATGTYTAKLDQRLGSSAFISVIETKLSQADQRLGSSAFISVIETKLSQADQRLGSSAFISVIETKLSQADQRLGSSAFISVIETKLSQADQRLGSSAFISVIETKLSQADQRLGSSAFISVIENVVNGISLMMDDTVVTIEPCINIGPRFQAVIPPLQEEALAWSEEHRASLVWEPWGDLAENRDTQSRVEKLLSVGCSSALPGGGANTELALHCLHEAEGDVLAALKTLLFTGPQRPPQHPLRDYHYAGSDHWTPEERNLFQKALSEHGKDFHCIQRELQCKTVAQCVEYYYTMKKHKKFLQPGRDSEEQDPGQEPAGLSVCKREGLSQPPKRRGGSRKPHRKGALQAQDDQAAHGGAVGFACKECGRVFLKIKSRNAHMKSHRQHDRGETTLWGGGGASFQEEGLKNEEGEGLKEEEREGLKIQ
ncbi:UNVERIFIED_CONTAM: hypothetical protein FKN15_040994 [Acipenser sinensis]